MRARLVTLCGCTKIVEMQPGIREWIVAIPNASVGHVDDIRFIDLDKVYESREPTGGKRVFRRASSRERSDLPGFEDMPEFHEVAQ